MNAAACRNCGHALGPEDRFCPSCGQKATDGLPTVRELFGQFVDEVLSLDSKFVRSYALLLARPGRLTREYLEGRRQRYVRPLRMYLISSLVFFLAASWFESGLVEIGSAESAADDDVASAVAVSDSTEGWFDDVAEVPVVGDRLRDQGRRLERMSSDEFERLMTQRLLRDLPRVIFLMVPVFAAILLLLYRRSGRRYAEHFVFALHGHAMAFLGLLVLGVIDWLPVDIAVVAYLALHAVLSLRTVYAQGWLKTVVKVLLVTGLYTVGVLVAVMGAAGLALVTI